MRNVIQLYKREEDNMKEKKVFQKAEIEVIRFEIQADIITTSVGEKTGPDSFGATAGGVQDSGDEF